MRANFDVEGRADSMPSDDNAEGGQSLNQSEHRATQHKKQCKAAPAAANKKYLMMMTSLKRVEGSFYSKMEKIFQKNEIGRQYYHGGKYNGIACSRLMQKAKEVFLEVQALLLDSRDESLKSEDEIKTFTNSIIEVFKNLDGIDKGLLPIPENVKELKTALKGAKKRWIDVRISKFQPKWHYVFDGHLLDQYENRGGLADKSDKTIEKGHQEWKILRQRFCRITNFEAREKAMVTTWCRRKHPNIQQALGKFRSQSPGTYARLRACGK